MTRPRQKGTMLATIAPLSDGRFHVALDWRPNETGVFTREEMIATALKMLCVADPKGFVSLCTYKPPYHPDRRV